MLVASEIADRAVQPGAEFGQFARRAIQLPHADKRLLHDVFGERRIFGYGHGEVVSGTAESVNQWLEPGASWQLQCHTSETR